MLAPTPDSIRHAGIVAVLAALLATGSDLSLLWLARRAVAGVPPSPRLTMAVTYVGALAILAYAVGYWQVACGLLAAGERLARRVFFSGAAMAGVGAVIHGMTGITLRYEALRGGDVSPTQMIASLLPLWVLGVACGTVLTALYVRAILQGPTGYPKWMAAANPMSLPAAVAAVSALGGPTVSALLVPAAPNIAHAIFFALTTVALRAGACASR